MSKEMGVGNVCDGQGQSKNGRDLALNIKVPNKSFLLSISRAYVVCVSECAYVCTVHVQMHVSKLCVYACFSTFQFSCILKYHFSNC